MAGTEIERARLLIVNFTIHVRILHHHCSTFVCLLVVYVVATEIMEADRSSLADDCAEKRYLKGNRQTVTLQSCSDKSRLLKWPRWVAKLDGSTRASTA